MTPTSVSSAGWVTASAPTAVASTGCPAASGSTARSAAAAAAVPAPGIGSILPEPCVTLAARITAGVAGSPKASRKQPRLASRRSLPVTCHGNTCPTNRRGSRRTARPRQSSIRAPLSLADRRAPTAMAVAATTAIPISSGAGAWSPPTPNPSAAIARTMLEASSNEPSAASVPASAGQLASGSSRLARPMRTMSPPRGERTPVSPAPQTCQAHARRADTPGQAAPSTAPQARPRDTWPAT
jgi:hypothetical protein